MEEYETFYDVVKESNGVARITIPIKLRDVLELKQDDYVKVLIRKIES